MRDPDELLDAFDDGLRPLGPFTRDEVHRIGLWHHVFHCLVVRTEAPARVLLQRRASTARSFAGLLDLSTTGHLRSGERPVDGVREIAEEIGVSATAQQLIPLGRRLLVDDSDEGRNREIVHAFLLPLDLPLDAFDIEQCDVDGLVEIKTAALLQILADPTVFVSCDELSTDGAVRHRRCSAADLVPATDGYWTLITIMAERFVAGRSPLAI
jgi:8-oxo-dGTP pyrophosphatase MutT (NUDIX family)